jgi:hypothetical protein
MSLCIGCTPPFNRMLPQFFYDRPADFEILWILHLDDVYTIIYTNVKILFCQEPHIQRIQGIAGRVAELVYFTTKTSKLRPPTRL